MSSILTNSSAMNALSTLRSVNSNLSETQNRISTGMKVNSAKDNASYFSISTTMNSESGMNKSVREGLTLAKNSVSTARLGAETMKDLAQKFVDRLSFSQNDGVDKAQVQKELDSLVEQMNTTIAQSSFNGENLIGGPAVAAAAYTAPTDGSVNMASVETAVTVTSGITRNSDGTLSTTSINMNELDLASVALAFGGVDVTTETVTMEDDLKNADNFLKVVINSATQLGIAEKAIETQQDFLSELTDKLDAGVGSMVDADMEQEAARLQSLQVQQQLATQSLSIANQAPQNILSLFR
ncbi:MULTISPECIES: flagellin N-terminal helical domain-containing protein [unclassified Sulfitobacter]|uniref:flagellin N-terminal helical domain-containing protein n=1 Tax=unclassified Sulfitobacter TaxID=196795 RepID=UPI0007C1FEA0|nr:MULTISPECIES: flagellin [unclassified Sulfitobacter]KZY02536.1 flagellar protein [Sulfitobacter sp. HI0023]KZY24049.1 flagellar protein [Sulfitobacter sp. HI0040]KZZ65355.1 flagellar protein [Sulfitobacter sp. HI0129]